MSPKRIQPWSEIGGEREDAIRMPPFPKTLLTEAFERAAELVRHGQAAQEPTRHLVAR